MIHRSLLFPILAVGLCVLSDGNLATAELPPTSVLSPNAPQDRPVHVKGQTEAEKFRAAIAPYVKKARETYAQAKKRFLAGLPAGHRFFVVTKIRDEAGRFEQVFIAVAAIKDDRITGRIASQITLVKGFKYRDPYLFPESELIDWLISNPDGTEEGNVVGKFLDKWRESQRSTRQRS